MEQVKWKFSIGDKLYYHISDNKDRPDCVVVSKITAERFKDTVYFYELSMSPTQTVNQEKFSAEMMYHN